MNISTHSFTCLIGTIFFQSSLLDFITTRHVKGEKMNKCRRLYLFSLYYWHGTFSDVLDMLTECSFLLCKPV